jgi:dynamin 1-like protein
MMYLHNVPRIIVPGAENVPPSSTVGAVGASVNDKTLLANSSSSSSAPPVPPPQDDWCEFQHRPGQRYYNFDEVKLEITREMERLAGRNRGISAEPICLTIHSSRVPDLVIIDLPGITKVPVGDQPQDIELQVRRLCLHYMSQQNNIILAVHPANQDLANSDALKLAMEADPDGERTIGVLTKVDLMDPGTDAREALSGRVIALRRGFVPVVCRSQKDIIENMPFSDGVTRERMFFERHYAYRAMSSRCGTGYLTKSLSFMLFTAIRSHLPSVRSQLSLAAQSYEQQLRELGEPVEAANSKEQGHLVLKLLSRFATNFCDMIEGRVHADAGSDLLIDELFGGARIQEIVRTRFNQWTQEWELLMDSQLRDDEILMAVRNSAGPRSALFIPEQAFTSLVKRQIVQLKDLGRRFADEIYDELRRIADKCEPPQLYRFGELREKAVEVVQNLLRRSFLPTLEMIDRLIDIEIAHVNTSHPDFVGAAKALEYVLLSENSHNNGSSNALDNGHDNDGDEGDPEYDGSASSSPDPQSHQRRYRNAGRRPGGGDAGGAGAGSATSSAAELEAATQGGDDVAWAIKRIGGNGRGSNSSESSATMASNANNNGGSVAGMMNFLGMFGGGGGGRKPTAADPSASLKNNTRSDDIRNRFGPRIVNEMLGEESLLLGAVRRVGGPNSPFVELPRASPLSKASHRGDGGDHVTGGSPLHGARWATPGSVNGLQTLSGRHQLPGGGGGGAGADKRVLGGGASSVAGGTQADGSGAPYQGMALLVVPQKPLPEVITPSDLRPDEKEHREIRIIRALLQSYLGIVKKNYTDMVPKTVLCMLVNKVKDEIASELVHHLYSQITSVDALLRETDDIASRRKELGDQLAVLNKGIAILNEIRDSSLQGGSIVLPTLPQSTSATSFSSSSSSSSAMYPTFSSKTSPDFIGGGGGSGSFRENGAPAGNSPGSESVTSTSSVGEMRRNYEGRDRPRSQQQNSLPVAELSRMGLSR